MELLQLRYFKALAERGHLTETAKDLLISAPSLSATITRLERELGVKLFDREKRNIRLNECGRIFLKHVNVVFSSLENAKLEMSDAVHKDEMHVSVASTSPTIWHDVFKAFFLIDTKIKVSHTIIKMDQLKDPSYCSQFDFIVTAANDISDPGWDSEILMLDDKPVFAVYPHHPFAGRKAVRFIDAKEENFIAISKGYSMRVYFDNLCEMAGFTPKIVLECDYMLRSKMLAAEYGIVFTTESGSRTGELGNAVYVEILDTAIRRTQAIFWNKDRYLSTPAKKFRDFMVEYHKEYSQR